MAFRPRHLRVQQLTFAASSLVTRELPKTVYRGLIMEYSVLHTNAISATVTVDTILDTLRSIAVVIDGQDNIVRLEGRDLYYMNQYDFSIAPFSSIFGTSSAQGTSIVQLYLPFIFTRALKPEDSMLDARKVSTIVLEVEFGSAANAGTNVTSLDSGTFRVITDEYANAPDELVSARHEMNSVETNLDQTGTILVDLEVGSNNQYRRLMVVTRGGSDELSSAELDQLIVRSRSFYYLNIDQDQMLQRWNRQQFALAAQVGVYMLNFTRDGQNTQRIDARNLSELIVEVNSLVTDGTIRVTKDKAIYA